MNPSKVMNSRKIKEKRKLEYIRAADQMDDQQLAVVFAEMVAKYDHVIRYGVRLGSPFREFGSHGVDDYLQEGLIECWARFRHTYYGYMSPLHIVSDGNKMTWSTWFCRRSKEGAIAYWRKCDVKRTAKTRAFSDLPDWFESPDMTEGYDMERDALFQTMEGLIEKCPAVYKDKITAYLETGCNFREACRHLGIPHNLSTIFEFHWGLGVIGHKLSLQKDRRLSFKFRKIRFGEAIKYALSLFLNCHANPNVKNDTQDAYGLIMDAAVELGIAEKPICDFEECDFLSLIFELKKEQYFRSVKPVAFKRRLCVLVDWFVEFGFLQENLLSGTNISKEGILVKRYFQYKASTRKTEKRPIPKKKDMPEILCKSSDGAVVFVFKTFSEAKRMGFDPASIKRTIGGQHNRHKGYCWEYGQDQDKRQSLAV